MVEEETVASRNVVNMSDFDATLYFLDEREIDYLQSEIRREYQADLRQNVAGILLDIFEQQTEPAIRAEIAEVLDSFMIHMLSAGQFHNVAYLVRESLSTAQRSPELIPEQRDGLSQIPTRLSAPEPLGQLLQSLDESDSLPPVEDVIALFEQLRASALGTLFDWLGKLQNPRLRPMLEQAATRLASQNTAELVRLIPSPTLHVSLEAIRRAGALQTGAAVAPLSRVIADGERDQRLAAVQALNEIGTPGALQALEKAVDDVDRDVRIATVRALGARAYRPVLSRIEAIVKGKAIRDADLTEKMAMFEAYGALCGEGGVATLDTMLNGKSLFGRREDPELRACAAVALGRIKSSNAQDALRKSANEKEVVVRSAVAKALRGGPA
jgi:HEAT repeat protein